jgi:hypothetical protein
LVVGSVYSEHTLWLSVQFKVLNDRWKLKYNSGQVPMKDGKFVNAADSSLYYSMRALMRPILADEADVAARINKERTFRQTALEHYGR